MVIGERDGPVECVAWLDFGRVCCRMADPSNRSNHALLDRLHARVIVQCWSEVGSNISEHNGNRELLIHISGPALQQNQHSLSIVYPVMMKLNSFFWLGL